MPMCHQARPALRDLAVDGVDYLIIVVLSDLERRELIIYCLDEGQVTGLSFWVQPDVYWVTMPPDERVVYTDGEVAEAIRLLTLEE